MKKQILIITSLSLLTASVFAGGGEEFVPCQAVDIECAVASTADIDRSSVQDPKQLALINSKDLFVSCSKGNDRKTVYYNNDAFMIFVGGKYRVYVNRNIDYKCTVKK